MERLKVGVLGATGMIGQNYIRLLESHPWFEVAYVAASPKSAGKRYADAVAGRWHMLTPIPAGAREPDRRRREPDRAGAGPMQPGVLGGRDG